MDEPIQHLRCCLHEWQLVFWELIVLVVKIKDHVQRILIIWNLCTKPCEVEVILYIILIHLNEEFIPLQVTEPFDPCDMLIKL